MFGAWTSRLVASSNGTPMFPTEGLVLLYDHEGLTPTTWAPKVDTYGIGTLNITSGTATITNNWGGGKPAASFSGNRFQVAAAVNSPALTWVIVGELPQTPGSMMGPVSSQSPTQKIYPFYVNPSGGWTIGTDGANGANNKVYTETGTPAIVTFQGYAGSYFAIAFRMLSSDFRAEARIGGDALSLFNNTESTVNNLIGGLSIGGWHTSGGEWTGRIALVAAYADAKDDVDLAKLVDVAAMKYGYANFIWNAPEPILRWVTTDPTFPIVNQGSLGSVGNLLARNNSTNDESGIRLVGASSAYVRTQSNGTPLEWAHRGLTMSSWVYRTGAYSGGYGAMLSKAANSASWVSPFGDPTMAVQSGAPSQLNSTVRNSGGTQFGAGTSGFFLPEDAWCLCTSTHDGKHLRNFGNGLQAGVGGAADIDVAWFNHGPWFLGSNHAVNSGFTSEYVPGVYQDVRVYDRALTPKQTRDLYNSPPPRHLIIPQNGLVWWFDLDTGVTLDAPTDIANITSRYGSRTYNKTTGAYPQLVTGWRNGKNAWSMGSKNTVGFQLTSTLTLNQPVTYVCVGSYTAAANFQFPFHKPGGSNALPFYQKSDEWLSQFAGTVRDHVLGTGSVDVPFIAIAVLNGASSTLWLRRHGIADYFGTVAGTVGTNNLTSTIINWGGSSDNADHHWRGVLAADGLYSGAKTTAWQTSLLEGLSDYYNIQPA